jgi:hypothetical protein
MAIFRVRIFPCGAGDRRRPHPDHAARRLDSYHGGDVSVPFGGLRSHSLKLVPFRNAMASLPQLGDQQHEQWAAETSSPPDAEDLGRGAIDAVFAVALTEQGRNQDAR